MKYKFSFCGLFVAVIAAAFSVPGRFDDPWTLEEILSPVKLAAELKTRDPDRHLFAVSSAAPFHSAHIPNALFAGPANKPKGIDLLLEAVKSIPHNAEMIIYCGCCPFVRCPNVRPAYRALKDLGYSNIKVLKLDTNLYTDWVEKGYTIELSTK